MSTPASAFVKSSAWTGHPLPLAQEVSHRTTLRHPPRDVLLRMSAPGGVPSPPRPHVAVSLDKPLIPSDPLFYATKQRWGPSLLFQSIGSLLASETVVRFAAFALVAALLYAVALRTSSSATASSSSSPPETTASSSSSSSASSSSSSSLGEAVRRGLLYAREKVSATVETLVSGSGAPRGTPMYFDAKSNEGWGVCTLVSKRRLGQTNFAQFDFELPDPDTYLDLELGQQVSLCGLDESNNVVRGDFFVYQPDRRSKPGSFSILVPNRSTDENKLLVGTETANLVQVLKQDMKVGDEIALKPGPRKLDYKGQYLPVTDMVYIAHGTGIVPVLEQVRTVLPSGSSTVKSVAVAWINEETRDFDVNADLLEREYFRYRKKMAVSCIVEDVTGTSLRESAEVQASVPSFQPGTMAVVAGPESFADKTVDYLRERGYPRDTICVL